MGLYALFLWGDWRLTGTYAQDGDGPDESRMASVMRDAADPPASGSRAYFLKGTGVPVGHVEGAPGDYLPNLQAPDFAGIQMTPRSGPSKVNGHAFATAKVIYGRTGMAPGIDSVHFYTTPHWMGLGVLRTGSPFPPDPDGRRVFTHSWISPGMAGASDVLRRTDYLIDYHGVHVVAGVNNGADTSVPALMASAYNAIAVGVASGNSSGGYTRHEGRGRCKPDVVVPRSTTSIATPVITATVARLLEAADKADTPDLAGKPEVIKAILMAGAVKPEGWHRETGKPLDEHLGAGVPRSSTSYAMLQSGPTGPDQPVGLYGWDFRRLPRNGHNQYRVTLDRPVGEASIMLVWNRRVAGTVKDLFTDQERWVNLPRLADFTLRLLEVGGGQSRVVAESASTVDNVEHIYIKDLPPGEYALEITRGDAHTEAWGYALAWRLDTQAAVPVR